MTPLPAPDCSTDGYSQVCLKSLANCSKSRWVTCELLDVPRRHVREAVRKPFRELRVALDYPLRQAHAEQGLARCLVRDGGVGDLPAYDPREDVGHLGEADRPWPGEHEGPAGDGTGVGGERADGRVDDVSDVDHPRASDSPVPVDRPLLLHGWRGHHHVLHEEGRLEERSRVVEVAH